MKSSKQMNVEKSGIIGSSSILRSNVLRTAVVALLLGAVAAPAAFAEEADGDSDEPMSFDDQKLSDLLRKIESEDDGDDDVPVKDRKPKVHSKTLSTYGAQETLRLKLNKTTFVDGYVDQGVGGQANPYKTPTSKFAGGFNLNHQWNGYTLTGGLDVRRNYAGTYSTWDGALDKTYSVGVARRIKISNEWAFTPRLRLITVSSDIKTKDARRTDLVLPLSFTPDKFWTIKALTVAYSTQTFTQRAEAQTDRTWTTSTGVAYKWSAKSTLDLTLSREQRYSNQSFSEYSKTTVLAQYEYRMSPTSSVGFGIGRQTHTNITEQFSRWLIVPKVQIRWDI